MIDVPPDAIRYLRQQRTVAGNPATDWMKAAFDNDVADFANAAKRFLPPGKSEMRFVDIGCGVGFGLLVLARIYGTEHWFVGIDRDSESAQIEYGFSESPSAYNSLSLTRQVLENAGIAADRIACVDIDVEPFPDGEADIITSTLAWGFHFPVDTYLRQVEASLKPDGAIIIDLRRGTGQDTILGERFEVVHSWPGQKSDRVILKRRK
jgi:SAM-dependent methyltransferase